MIRAVTQNRFFRSTHIVMAGLVFSVLLGACGGADAGPEEQLRQWVILAQEAAEAKERSDLLDMISPAYVDPRGNQRGDISNMLRLYFFRQHTVKLVAMIGEIRLHGQSAAEVDLTIGMAGTNDGVFGFSADAYEFQLELELDGDEWMLISARWSEIGQELY